MAAGRTLIITGASRGIGRALALALAEQGFDLVLNARTRADLAAVVASCHARGAAARAVVGDIGLDSTQRQLLVATRGLQPLWGFIHNAGISEPGPLLWEIPVERQDALLRVHLTAALGLIRVLIPPLLAQGSGVVVFLGSGAAELAVPGVATYCVAKAALEHLARQLAAEAPQIASFVYRPGMVETQMQREARQARGGAGAFVRAVFTDARDSGQLIRPADSVARLVQVLTTDPQPWQGRVLSWDDPAALT